MFAGRARVLRLHFLFYEQVSHQRAPVQGQRSLRGERLWRELQLAGELARSGLLILRTGTIFNRALTFVFNYLFTFQGYYV